MTPISQASGKKITTIEGLSATNSHRVQQAWADIAVPQCGYCQIGQMMSAAALLEKNAKPSDHDIDTAMAGNLCPLWDLSAHQTRNQTCGGDRLMRRDTFLRTTAAFGGGLALATLLVDCSEHPARVPDAQPSAEPSVSFSPNAWVHVRTDGSITVMLAKSEMGQARRSVRPHSRRVRAGRRCVRRPVFKDMTTGGSTSMQDSYLVLRSGCCCPDHARRSGGQALERDARELHVTRAGFVHHAPSKRSVEYRDIATEAAAQKVPADVKLKDASQFTLIGTSPKRLDLDRKVHANVQYGIDVVVPGMLFANVLRPPTFDGAIDTLDGSAARKVPGVVDVVRVSGGVGVVATNTWAARCAAATRSRWRGKTVLAPMRTRPSCLPTPKNWHVPAVRWRASTATSQVRAVKFSRPSIVGRFARTRQWNR